MNEYSENIYRSFCQKIIDHTPTSIKLVHFWLLQDVGFHSVYPSSGFNENHRDIARAACIQNRVVVKKNILAIPFTLSMKISGAVTVQFCSEANTDICGDIIELISKEKDALRQAISFQKIDDLPVELIQSNALSDLLQCAHALEHTHETYEALKEVHKELKNLINAKNFFCATMDDQDNIHIEYIQDEYHTAKIIPPIPLHEGILRGSLTAYVISTQQALQGSYKDLSHKMGASNEVFYGQAATDWLGVPIKTGTNCIGALVIQSYDAYDPLDTTSVAILTLLADSVGAALLARRNRLHYEKIIKDRTEELENSKIELESSLELIKSSQKYIIEAEKQASLGRLVTGIAHELNTPLGIGITSISMIASLITELSSGIENGTLTKQNLNRINSDLKESTNLIENSLRRAAELVTRFKAISTGTEKETIQHFQLLSLLDEIKIVYQNKFKNKNINFFIDIPEKITLTSYASALFEVISHVIDNSIQHAFKSDTDNRIQIDATTVNNQTLLLAISDNGLGIDDSVIHNIYDPFFTTARAEGHIGMGLHIVHNIVTQTLKGSAYIEKIAPGIKFVLSIPLIIS
ncbi:MAG: HAMP domain-containing sensor histidine kinase [Reinekea sp.]|nr:HAMP domain-containing sensor histidine kinase [Reinekea sp.]